MLSYAISGFSTQLKYDEAKSFFETMKLTEQKPQSVSHALEGVQVRNYPFWAILNVLILYYSCLNHTRFDE